MRVSDADRPCPDALIQFAAYLANQARPVTQRYFRQLLTIIDKPDQSPVTQADRETEALLRQQIKAHYPDHGVLGEEFGADRPDEDYVWVLDPIDGTKSFITGRPLFGTLIALCHKGIPILGVIDMPILAERWIGASGHPTRMNGAIVHTQTVDHLADLSLFATHPAQFAGAHGKKFAALAENVKFIMYGSDCYHYGLLASGHAGMAIESSLHIYDFAAAIPIVTGAGGVISDWQGHPLTLQSGGDVLASANSIVHEAALKILR